MKMVFVFALVIMLLVLPIKADDLVIRANGTQSAAPSYDVFIFTPKLEVLAFDVKGSFPIYEVGRLFVASSGKRHIILAGVYGSRWEKARLWFVEPYALVKAWSGKTTATAKLFVYLPVNHGGTFVGMDELSLTHKVLPSLEVGVEGSFFKQNPSPVVVKWGPTVRLKKGDTSVSFRAQSFGKGTDTCRLTLSRSFS